jgi:hypothetical protein
MSVPVAELNDKYYTLPNQSEELLDDLKWLSMHLEQEM